MIKIKNVSKIYKQGFFKKNIAVDNVSIDIESGKILGIAGSSGCGKSTLARMIMGLLECSNGNISVEGLKIKNLKRKELSKYIQIIFQHPENSFDPKMTIGDSLLEAMWISGGFAKKESKEKILSVINSLNLESILLNRYPSQISGGEAQRLSIARALLLNPKIIVLDEPTSMLDVSVQASIFKLLSDIHKEFSLTIILISHDLEILSRICDNLIVMNNGKIVDIGKTQDVLINPKSEFTEELIANFEFFN